MLQLNYSGFILETGTDEAGRGCLAGPVTAAAVILPHDFNNEFLNDSKQLSEKIRKELKPIIEDQAVCFSVTHLHADEIDEINILNASMKGMQECILKLKHVPEFIIVDGNRSLNAKLGLKNAFGRQFSEDEITLLKSIPNQSIIKGDAKYLSIAAASVLAKTYRDEFMDKIHEEFPMYNWKQNKGYPTKEHREAIKEFGTTKYHRMSFRLLPEQLELNFLE
ncbi:MULTISPECIES: ribonuclease HII [unclassified Flavobacterium]|jgi:ribonuclease HII|uniref:ribonuclease HII n=1 Tax=unclassified Flavobacterium TaxID=196869 RepID=UPI001065771A|nr:MULTISPECIES: ribonuclease HII [unclassified Flavobacterium]MDQ1164470.1 ribonuclease HII [Flavobacterium sp. SORGH_AS_0622]TDX14393.1 RNase HII [Flavobacterium sp. S87F.05.LMB.W.Kidney.N]